MEINKLLVFRIIVPGILGYSLFITLISGDIDGLVNILQSFDFKNGTLSLIAALVIGSFYYTSNIRMHLFGNTFEKVDQNIKTKLLDLNDRNLGEHEEKIQNGNYLHNIFYKICDNDESLKAKMKFVYLNGLIHTSAYDVAAFTLLSSISHSVYCLIQPNSFSIMISISSILTFFLFFLWAGPKTSKLHMELSNDQLSFIEQHHKDEVREEIWKTLCNLLDSE